MKNYLFFLPLILTFFFFSCTSKKEEKAEIVLLKTLGRVIKDSVAYPVVTKITTANAPKVIKAAKPIIVPLNYPYGVGIPSFTHYSIKDGLPNSYVGSTAVDHEGNIWFGTNSGLSKFDGTSFINYNSGNGLANDFIGQIFIDSKNNIWVNAHYGLNIFNGNFFEFVEMDKNVSPDKIGIQDIMEDNKGVIWISAWVGLYKYENNKFTKYTTADGLPDNLIRSVLQDNDGALLISTNKGVSRYDGKTFKPYTKIPSGKAGRSPLLIYMDSKGIIWFNDFSNGLGSYDGKQIKVYTEKDGYLGGLNWASIHTFIEDKNGTYWIGGSKGLVRFDGKKFINYSSTNGFPLSRIFSVVADKQGNIWAGSPENGICKINSSYLTSVETPGDDWSIVITIDKFGNKWSSGRKGLGKYASDHIAYYGRELLSRWLPSKALIDHAGNIWFHFYDYLNNSSSLVKFDGTNYTIFGKNQGISFTRVQHMIEDDSNNIWIAGDGGVTKFDGSSFTHYGIKHGLKSEDDFYSILQDNKNNFWFGSGDSGVYKYDGKQFINYSTHDGIPHNFINDLAEDALGNIWLATDGGAAKFDGKTFTSYRSNNGLDNTISDVLYDSVHKALWFTTGIGLASIKMENIGDEKPFFQHYNSRTGFDFSFSVPRSFTIDNKGTAWGSDFNKTFRFDFQNNQKLKIIPIQIRNVKLDNKNVNWSTLHAEAYPDDIKDSLTAINEMALKFGNVFSAKDFQVMTDAFGKVKFDSVTGSGFIPVNLTLPIINNNITIEFGSTSTSFGKAIQYQFKLEGYDKNWSKLSTKTEASFGNMSEGNYTFRVKALSPLGSWSETSYSFKVLPPWWRTWWAYSSYVLILGIVILSFIRLRTKTLQKEKIILEEKVTTRTSELKETLENLKATQSQLIQSEKMASLGELTAGIAHEIQNPLNFVNNFSEVSNELVDEMNAELAKGDIEEAQLIAKDVKQNLEKITHHGKRADAIVKGMLQHSRSGSGQKEPTDINKLCDEYLRLAYHGLRAKDKSFNAAIKTEFDETIGFVNILPQDVGRVVLNLITNAFYAVADKAKQRNAVYEPMVKVSTKNLNNQLEIAVSDNGNGIAKEIAEKIFQPFFTTKPTGEGTGLGLSLSYDIIKAHGGEIKMVSSVGEGTSFIINLPKQ